MGLGFRVKPPTVPVTARSYGIAHSAGLSRYLAEWIAHGEPLFACNELYLIGGGGGG